MSFLQAAVRPVESLAAAKPAAGQGDARPAPIRVAASKSLTPIPAAGRERAEKSAQLEESRVSPAAAAAWSVTLTGRMLATKLFQLSAVANQSLGGTGYTMAIYDQITGARVAACTTSGCGGNASDGYKTLLVSLVPQATTTELSSVAHTYVATISPNDPAYPPANPVATSPAVTAPAVSVTFTSAMSANKTVSLMAASNYNLNAADYVLAIYDQTTGRRLASCGEVSPCAGNGAQGFFSLSLSIVPAASTTELSRLPHAYVATLSANDTAYPPSNLADMSDATRQPAWSVSLTGSVSGSRYLLTATTNYNMNPSIYTLGIYDATTGIRVGVCGEGIGVCTGNGRDGFTILLTSIVPTTRTYVAMVSGDSANLVPPNIAAISNLVTPVPAGPTSDEGIGGCNPVEIMACAKSAGDPVDLDTGAYFDSQQDLQVPGRGAALDFTRTYDTRMATTQGRLGYGWIDSYDWLLSVDTSSAATAGQITIRHHNGSETVFSPNGFGGFLAPSRILASLVKNDNGTYTYTMRRTQRLTFSAAGKLMTIKDPNDYTTSLGYDGAGRLSTVTDPAGRQLRLAYDASDRIHTVTDDLPRVVTYEYDTDGNLDTVTDADGRVWDFGYDAAHRLTSVTDPRGNTRTNAYGATTGKVSQQTDRRGKILKFTYGTPASDGSITTTVTHPRGNKDVYTYLNHRLLTIVRGSGSSSATTETRTYGSFNGLTGVTTAPGHSTTYSNDVFGNRLKSVDALGRTTTWTYNEFNKPLTEQDALGVTTTYTYDANGNLKTVSRPLVDSDPPQTATVTNTYGDSEHPGDITSVTDANGKVTRFGYDTYGNRTSVTDATGRTTTTAYNEAGWITSAVSAAGNASGGTPAQHTTRYSNFTGFGNPETVTDPLGHTTTYNYDGNQNLTDVTDADGRHTRTDYNQNNDPTLVTRPDGTTQATAYDDNGNVLTQTDGLNHPTTYGYDSLDRLTSSQDALGRITTRTFDAAGNLATVVRPAGGTAVLRTTHTYNVADELTGVSYSDGVTPGVTYSYDALGQRETMTDGTGTTTYDVDSLHRLTQVTNGAGRVVKYAHDLKGNATQITYPDGGVLKRGFDDAGRLVSMTDWITSTPTTFAYDRDGNWSGTTYVNGVSGTRTYDANRSLTAVSYGRGATALGAYSYTRTPAQLLASSTPSGGAPGANATYAHTANGQLKSTAGPTAPATWTYDAADRLTGNPAGTTFAYDAADQLTTSASSSTPSTTYAYDTRGNRTSQQIGNNAATQYTYDQANQLKTFTTAAGIISNYTYDGDGLRASKATAGNSNEVMTWDTTSKVPLLLNSGSTSYLYGPGGTPIEEIDGGSASYLHQDQLNSTSLITNDAGTTAGRYSYDPYGKATHTGTATTALRFNGQYTDEESGLIYLRARYYDPATSQFLTVDPLSMVTRSNYAYAGGQPLDVADPLGLWGWRATFTAVSIGLAVAATIGTFGTASPLLVGALTLGAVGIDAGFVVHDCYVAPGSDDCVMSAAQLGFDAVSFGAGGWAARTLYMYGNRIDHAYLMGNRLAAAYFLSLQLVFGFAGLPFDPEASQC